MADPRLQLLRDSYAALNRGDLAGAFANIDPAFELHTTGALLDRGEVYRGPDGVRRFLGLLSEAFDEFEYVPAEVLETPTEGRFLVVVDFRARGRESGVETGAKMAHLWEMRGDTAISLQPFQDRDEARAAAGLT